MVGAETMALWRGVRNRGGIENTPSITIGSLNWAQVIIGGGSETFRVTDGALRVSAWTQFLHEDVVKSERRSLGGGT